MFRKVSLLISVCLVLGLGGGASANLWTNADPCDELWTTPGNWDDGVPTLEGDDTATLSNPDVNGPLVRDGMVASCFRFQGPGYSLPPGSDLTITGGRLTFGRYWRIGFGPAAGIVNMSGGILTNTSGYAVYMNEGSTFNLSGGVVRSGFWIPSELSTSHVVVTTLNMTGGTVNAKDPNLTSDMTIEIGVRGQDGIPRPGLVNLHGGTIFTHQFVIGPEGQMDITEGMLVIDGDVTATIEGYVNSGVLTAYGGAGQIVHYHDGVDDVTIVTAVAESPFSFLPQPGHGSEGLCPDVVLEWNAGQYAAWQDVYFGTDFNDVNEATTSSDVHVSHQSAADANYDPPDLLDFGTTYYWRVDAINDACSPYLWKGRVWSFTVDSGKARNPGPPDLAWRVPTDTDLGWEPGCLAESHDVYLGTDLNDVKYATTATSGVYKGRHGSLSYEPGVLDSDTMYYWRIDEVSAAVVKGDVWNFETIGPGQMLLMCDVSVGESTLKEGWSLLTKYDDYPETGTGGYGSDDGPVTWSDMNSPDGTPTGIDLTLDTGASGYLSGRTWGGEPLGMDYFFANDQGGSPDADIIIKLANLLPGTYRLTTFHNNTWYGYGAGPIGEVTVTGGITYSDMLTPLPVEQTSSVTDAGVRRVVVDFDATGAEDVTLTYKPGGGGAVYLNGFILDYSSVDKRYAYWPLPRHGARDVQPDVELSWSPGIYAADPGAHDVYFGTGWDDVNSATTSSSVYIGPQNLDANTYDSPGLLDLATTYYWRIDERNDANGNLWKGNVWRFATANYLLVDDMESYDSMPGTGNEVFDTWDDGFSNGTGSQLALEYGENATLHGGKQSMKFGYNNAIAYYKYSEIDANTTGPRPGNLKVGLDWTHDGVKALTLFFYGQAGNDITEQMYAALEDSSKNIAISKYGDMDQDMNDVADADWHQWDIPLSAFGDNSVTLTDVNKVRVGFGDRNNPAVGGAGVVFFDDIRIYLPKCVPWLIKPAADFSGNCVVDFADVGIMAAEWLSGDIDLRPVTAPNAPVLHYRFDENSGTTVADSSNGYTGTFFITADQTPAEISGRMDPGRFGNSFHFAADLGYGGIAMPTTVFTENSISQEITVAVWIKNAHPEEDPDSGAFMWEFRQWDGISPDANERVLAVEVSDGDTYILRDSSEGVSYDHDWDEHTEWQHYAFVRDAANLKIYVNGLEQAVSDSNTTAMATPDLLYVGISADRAPGNTSGLHDGFTGNMDDWQIYNYALSAGQIGHVTTDGTGIFVMESAVNLYDKESPGLGAINLRDYAVLMENWLEEELWPQ